jgi:Ca2+-binding RTX toxin-like protein
MMKKIGTRFDDNLVGTSLSDLIYGGLGNDLITVGVVMTRFMAKAGTTRMF